MGLFNKKELRRIAELEKELETTKLELSEVKKAHEKNLSFMKENKISECQEAKSYLDNVDKNIKHLESEEKKHQYNLNALSEDIDKKTETLQELTEKTNKQNVTLENLKQKIKILRSFSKDIQNAIKSYHEYDNETTINEVLQKQIKDLDPTIELKLNCLDMKELRKRYRDNEKHINELLSSYESRYTTKANQTIYRLMVIGLKAELQNTLLNLKYEKEGVSINYIEEICEKYRVISSDGNQSIAKTINRFISEIEILFKNAIHIEYEYYVQKERQKAEQAAIREQMKQEAEERRILEQQKKQVEKEESKYHSEMENVRNLLESTIDQNMKDKYLKKIAALEKLLADVQDKKEEIINRQNGKAGNVYIISNLGSFGENVFKVGMTRRLEPMDRVKELGSASVPFSFDVHAMIFSEDAVGLENKLHQILNEYRLNKINLRKEFFKVDLDTIENIVLKEDPAAAFNRTMLAEDYRQSLSVEEVSN